MMKQMINYCKRKMRSVVNSALVNDKFKLNYIVESKLFDENWYRETYNIPKTINPAEHYLNIGWKLRYNPSRHFSTLNYLVYNDDVAKAEINPLLHYEKHGKYENNRVYIDSRPEYKLEGMPDYKSEKQLQFSKKIQDERLKEQYDALSKKIVVFILPENDGIGGGVMSICSIARVSRSLCELKDSAIVLATVPSFHTFENYTSFDAGFDIFRFEQLHEYFTNAEEIMVHLPEVFIGRFWLNMSVDSLEWLRSAEKLRINILNQNIELMPRPEFIDRIRPFGGDWSMTCAHYRYCTKQIRTSYNMPVHMLSTSNLVKYEYRTYAQKENLLVYSCDESPFKQQVLDCIKKSFPKMKMVEIKNMKYDKYLETISKAKWMITFGEGVDGYFLESVRCGAISFAVRNKFFFDYRFNKLETIYDSYSQMVEKIVDDIKTYDNETEYERINNSMRQLDLQIYNDDEYKENIHQFYLDNYTFDMVDVCVQRENYKKEPPLISIVMATYNGEKYIKKQLESINNLTWPNIELIISDDGSKDNTLKIINEHNLKVPFKLVHNKNNHGLNGNFANAFSYAKGDFFAMCDQDDIWEPDKLNVLMDRIDDFDIVFGNMVVIDQNDNIHPEPIMHSEYEVNRTMQYDFIDYLTCNPMLGCASLMRREVVERALPIPEGFLYHDWWMVLHAIKYGKGVCFIDKPVLKYRQHDSNTAKNTFDNENWSKWKLRSNDIIDEYFGDDMSREEKIMLECDSNRWRLLSALKKFSFSYAEEFANSNILALTNETIETMYERIHKKVN